jgi:uncharacterized protein (DUF302 family)
MRNAIRFATTCIVAVVALAGAACADIVKIESPHTVKVTMDRLESIVTEKKFKVLARIDHGAGAKSVDLELRPTELLIFGNPAGGTPIMQAEQTMGLSLPLKVLAWQDAEGKVWLGYDAPASEFAERGLPADHPAVQKLTDALQGMTGAAVKK